MEILNYVIAGLVSFFAIAITRHWMELKKLREQARQNKIEEIKRETTEEVREIKERIHSSSIDELLKSAREIARSIRRRK